MFFFNDTATTEIYTLSLHDALPIWDSTQPREAVAAAGGGGGVPGGGGSRRGALAVVGAIPGRADADLRRMGARRVDRKSTRLNSSHANISYAVFCLKKKKPRQIRTA